MYKNVSFSKMGLKGKYDGMLERLNNKRNSQIKSIQSNWRRSESALDHKKEEDEEVKVILPPQRSNNFILGEEQVSPIKPFAEPNLDDSTDSRA